MIPSSWNGTNIRRLMSCQSLSSWSEISSLERNASARLSGSNESTSPATPHSHATITFVYALLRSFETCSGYPMLLNTSFNLAGEPIVESPKDAIVTYLKSDIDVLVMQNFYVIGKPRTPPDIRGQSSSTAVSSGLTKSRQVEVLSTLSK